MDSSEMLVSAMIGSARPKLPLSRSVETNALQALAELPISPPCKELRMKLAGSVPREERIGGKWLRAGEMKVSWWL